MALDLVTPIGVNFLKDWPAQNAGNCDLIDSFAGPCLPSHALQNFTPILTATSVNPTLGSGGLLLGKFYRVFHWIYYYGEFRFGTGATVGSGIYRISLPRIAKTLLHTIAPFDPPISIGNGIVFDESLASGRQPVSAALTDNNNLVFQVRMGTAGSTRGVSHNTPITWTGAPAPGDGIQWGVRYMRHPDFV